MEGTIGSEGSALKLQSDAIRCQATLGKLLAHLFWALQSRYCLVETCMLYLSTYSIPCGPSIMDYPETSGNLRKPAAAVSGRFPDFH